MTLGWISVTPSLGMGSIWFFRRCFAVCPSPVAVAILWTWVISATSANSLATCGVEIVPGTADPFPLLNKIAANIPAANHFGGASNNLRRLDCRVSSSNSFWFSGVFSRGDMTQRQLTCMGGVFAAITSTSSNAIISPCRSSQIWQRRSSRIDRKTTWDTSPESR